MELSIMTSRLSAPQTFSSLDGDGEQFLLPSRSLFVGGSYVYQAPFYDNATIFESASAAASRPYGYLKVAASAPATLIPDGPLFGNAGAMASLDELFSYSHSPGIDYWAKLRVLARGSLSINAPGYGSAGGVFTEEFERLDSDFAVIQAGSASLRFPYNSDPTFSRLSDIVPDGTPTAADEMRMVFGALDTGYGYIDLYIPITERSHNMYMRSSLLAAAAAGTADFSHTALFSMEVPLGESWSSQSGQFLTAQVPEPEIYALILTGLGLLGWVKGRMKQNDALPLNERTI